MAGKNGFYWVGDRPFEDLSSLKKYCRQGGLVQEVRSYNVVATGAAGATIDIEEATGTDIDLASAELQVYIRAHTNDNDYDGETISLSWLDDDGVIHDAVTTAINTTDSTTEVAVSGADDFYRVRDLYTSRTPKTGHFHILTDDACSNVDGSGGDVYGMIEENNYSMITSRYFVPSRYLDSTTRGTRPINSYLGKFIAKYDGPANGGEDLQYATLKVTCTPEQEGYETVLDYVVHAGTYLVWESPFQLKAATDVTFQVVDDSGDGGNFELETIIVEQWAPTDLTI